MEMAERLAQILGDENAMSQIRQMAEGMDPSTLGDLMGMLSGNGGTGGNGPASQSAIPMGEKDPNVELLQALRPFLSQKRKKKAKEAVKIMKMMEMLPLLQQSGLLKNLMGGDEEGDD